MSKYFKQLAGLSVKPPNKLNLFQPGTVPVNTAVPVITPSSLLTDEHIKTDALSTGETATPLLTGTVPVSTKKPLGWVEPTAAIANSHSGTVPETTSVPDDRWAPNLDLVPVAGIAAVDSGLVPDNGTVPANGSVPFVSKSRTRVFRATRVEHAHTPGERLVLQSLWTNAAGNDKERTIRIGYDRLASLSGFNWKTARSCLRSLEDKLAIETLQAEDSNSRLGRLYRIYSFDTILERRRLAGLEWVQKGRGVEFVRTGTVPENGSVPLTTAVPDRGRNTPPLTGMGTPPVTGTGTVPSSGAPLRSNKNKKESSTDVVVIRTFVEQALAPMDEDAAKTLLETCKDRAGDQAVTVSDIIGVIRMKSGVARKANNPIGFLLAAVPKSFPLRTTELESPEQEDSGEDFEYWERVLTSPDASTSQLSYARKLLANRS